jgi:hypothetical protein
MRYPKLMMMCLASLLTASCASMHSAAVDGRPVEELRSPAAQPPASIITSCSRPVDLQGASKSGMSAGEVERLWARDRSALEQCRQRHGALIAFMKDRDAALSGAAR